MKNITFAIFTFNEEKRIAAVVRNFIKYGDVLVLDDGSTDHTKDIAESLGARVVRRPALENGIVESQGIYNFILSETSTKWLFWTFADNFAPKSLLEKLKEISEQEKIKYVNVPLYTYLWGETEYVTQKSYSPRFFTRDAMDFSDNHIHGMGKFLGQPDEVLTLPMKDKYALYHYSLYNTEKFILSHMRYAAMEAEEKFKSGKKFSSVRLLAAMARYFWLYYKNGRKNKQIGLIIALLYSCFRLMTYGRLYELENDLTIEKIEKKYNEAAEKILQEI